MSSLRRTGPSVFQVTGRSALTMVPVATVLVGLQLIGWHEDVIGGIVNGWHEYDVAMVVACVGMVFMSWLAGSVAG